MTRWGATLEEWDHWSLIVGLTTEMLPVVSNPNATIAPDSKLKTLGKVPSQYDRVGQAVGIGAWTSRRSSNHDIERWRRKADYGICLQTRTVRAIDIDIEDPTLAKEVEGFIVAALGFLPPVRYREGSPRQLLAFRLGGTRVKEVIRTAGGAIEFLADGQQFIASGTHPKGQRFTWRGGLPDEFPTLAPEQFDKMWQALAERFAITGQAVVARQGVRRVDQVAKAQHSDPVAQYLIDNEWWLGNNRDGSLNITCPFEKEHSAGTGNESATTYWPAHTGGFAQGHFKCLHAHCAERSDHAFLVGCGYEASQFGLVEARTPDEEPAEEERRVIFERHAKTGKKLTNLHNLSIALAHEAVAGAAIMSDTFRDDRLIAKGGEGPRPMTEADAVMLRQHLEREIGFEPIGREIMRDALTAHGAKHGIDSAQAWLERQPWDGEPRVERFAETYLRAPDTPYARAVSRYLWSALAGRVMLPGSKVDMSLVLSGAQGIGKSLAVKAIAPLIDTYVEINLDVHDDNLSRLVRGKLVGELAELRGLGTRDAEAIKAWLSRTHEEWVPKYQEYVTKYPRRVVFIGTTNQERFLADETGERRWLPMALTRDIDVGAIERDRDQLWAEGLALWRRSGIQWASAERLAPEVHEAHKVVDTWDEEIAKWLNGVEFGDSMNGSGPMRWSQFFTGSQILAGAIGLKTAQMGRREEMRVAGCLKRLGFTSKSVWVEGAKARRWVCESRVGTDLV